MARDGLVTLCFHACVRRVSVRALQIGSLLIAACSSQSGTPNAPGSDSGSSNDANPGTDAPMDAPAMDSAAPETGSDAGTQDATDAPIRDVATQDTGTSDAGIGSCPTAMPTGNETSGGHTWTLVGQDDFTKDAPLGSFASDGSSVVYTGDHGMQWMEYGDGWPSTYTGGKVGYEPSQVQSVHDGVLDWFLHNVPSSGLIADLRHRYPRMPLVCSTAASAEQIELDSALRPDAILYKPFAPDELRATLDAFLAR